jgi:two-component system response regulator VicR
MSIENKYSNEACVLLVDDDEDWLQLMQTTLKKVGLHAVASINGEDLWEKIDTCHPDVILLDIHMNGISGEVFCRSLKTNPATSAIPILMYSSNQDIDQIAKRCGADGFVSKSVSTKTVKEMVMQYV